MIPFNRFSGNVINHVNDNNGNWVMVLIEFNEVNYTLVCVYNRRTQNRQLYSSLSKK